jgi:hypothetical protein
MFKLYKCSKCLIDKCDIAFSPDAPAAASDPICKKCAPKKPWKPTAKKKYNKLASRAYTLANRSKIKDNYLKNIYGKDFGLETYNKMFEAQGGACAICKKPESRLRQDGSIYDLVVDLNRTTGQVRGLLCVKCNYYLGLDMDKLRNQLELITRAVAYLDNTP